MFDEPHPSEVVSASLPLHHDIWSSIKRCCDADFDKTRDVFQGTAMHVTHQNRNEDTTLATASGVAATQRNRLALVGCGYKPDRIPLSTSPKITGVKSRGVILSVCDESSLELPSNRNTVWLLNQSRPRKCAPEVDMFTLKSYSVAANFNHSLSTEVAHMVLIMG